MTTDSGMTVDKAREIVKKWPGVLHDEISSPAYCQAQGFLQGVAYQEEKAKGLVEALERVLEMNGCANAYATIKEAGERALAHYREGQEKP